MEVGSLLLCEPQELNSDHQGWWQVPLSVELSLAQGTNNAFHSLSSLNIFTFDIFSNFGHWFEGWSLGPEAQKNLPLS